MNAVQLKTFFWCLGSTRNGNADGRLIIGGSNYNHTQLLAAVDATDVRRAAQSLGTRIVGKFDRGDKLPTLYYTSNWCGRSGEKGYFFLYLKEVEKGDEVEFPNFQEVMRLKVAAPLRGKPQGKKNSRPSKKP